MANRDGSRSEPRRLRRDRVLVQPRAIRLANQAGRLHKDLAPTLVRAQAREAPLVQGPSRRRNPRIHAARRDLGGGLSDSQRS